MPVWSESHKGFTAATETGVLHQIGWEAGAVEEGANGDCRQLPRLQPAQSTTNCPYRNPNGACNHDLALEMPPQLD